MYSEIVNLLQEDRDVFRVLGTVLQDLSSYNSFFGQNQNYINKDDVFPSIQPIIKKEIEESVQQNQQIHKQTQDI